MLSPRAPQQRPGCRSPPSGPTGSMRRPSALQLGSQKQTVGADQFDNRQATDSRYDAQRKDHQQGSSCISKPSEARCPPCVQLPVIGTPRQGSCEGAIARQVTTPAAMGSAMAGREGLGCGKGPYAQVQVLLVAGCRWHLLEFRRCKAARARSRH